jgi:threonine dehydratase
VRGTPLRRSAGLAAKCGCDVYLKLENRQVTGSFKVRGALNALTLRRAEAREMGVVTASAGNHGAGVAHAARLLRIPATIFVPANAPAAKRERILSSGADLRLVEGGYDAAHQAAEAFAEGGGGIYLHAFSDPAVVAGQGTVGLEILERVPLPGTLLVPVGGGGLVGGVGIVARALAPGARVVGVQTPATSAMHDSLARDHVVAAPDIGTLCDGLEGDTDARSLALAKRVVDEMILVDEEAVARAVAWLSREEGETVEPSGAVAVAALLEGIAVGRGPVVAVVSGGNVDAELLAELMGSCGERADASRATPLPQENGNGNGG